MSVVRSHTDSIALTKLPKRSPAARTVLRSAARAFRRWWDLPKTEANLRGFHSS